MRFGSVLYLLATSIVCANANDSVAKGLEETVYRAIETGLNGVEIVPVDALDPQVDKCFVTSSVTCVVTDTGKDCEDLVIPIEQCRDIDMTFTYRYCSIEEDKDVRLIPEKTTALIETLAVNGLNYNDLSPGKCREFSIVRKIDTCKRFYSASLKVEGKRGNDFDNGDYCYAWDFLRIFIKRPCEITSTVKSCTVTMTGEDCFDYIVPIDECEEDELFEFVFEYCNNEDTDLKFRTQKFRALVETLPVNGFDLSDLPSKECRTFTEIRPIDACKTFFSSSLKVEGWRGDGLGDYCYAYDFERIYTRRPDDPPRTPGDDTPCDVTSSVKCFMAGTNDRCEDIKVPLDECDEETEMTFEFEYCNFEEENSINLFGGKKTIAKVELLKPMPALDLSVMAPGECRTYRENRKINTCKRFFSASLKVEGRRGDNYGDYCYAYDFYRSYIKRPQTNENNTPGVTVVQDCDISASITCTIDATGEECDDIVVPRNQCKLDEDMTFVFEYCSREPTNTIDLNFELTRARVETIGLPGLNYDDLQPGECRRLVSTQKISTCNNLFSAQLKVEGVRNDVGGYCYGWDFYRSYIARSVQNAPSPSGPNNDDEAPCAVSAQVKCTLVSNGQNCKDIVVPFDECDEETPMIFEFEYCNFEESEEIELKQDKTRALIETLPVNSLNLNNIPAGQCRRRIETRNINTCKAFFSAQLKVEGLRGGDSNDYCYAFDFLREYIKRVPDGPTPVAAPTPQGPSGACDISAEVTCTIDATGESCGEIKVSIDDCEVDDTAVTFKFKYCNRETESFIALKEDLTTALIETIEVDGLDRSEMDANECRTFTRKRQINTCKSFFSASLKVEGLRDGVTNDYCYAWDFLRTYIKRPDNSPVPVPTECEISANISCTYDRTGEPCENIVISDEDCNTSDSVTFDFEMCSEETMVDVTLREDKTVALVETIPVENFDKSPLRPGECRRTRAKRRVNTCKNFFSAGLKVEGKRLGYDGYCFAYDHLRAKIFRAPTTSPSTFPTFSPSVSVLPTNAPTICRQISGAERTIRIIAIILQISDIADFDNPNSPQSKARDWMINEDRYDVFCANACSKSEFGDGGGVFQRYTLAVFYFSTNGDTWKICGRNNLQSSCIPKLTNKPPTTFSDNELWLSVDKSECLWGGLACDNDTFCLDRIEFEANNVNGVIPYEIEQLNSLRFLILEGAINGTDYNDGSLTFLQGDIPSLDNLDRLIVLDLNYNQLTGPIPDGVWNMSDLRQLDLNDNFLTGKISPKIGDLLFLRFLQLNHNEFTGELPQDSFGRNNAKDLVSAEFQKNSFTGFVPSGLCELLGVNFRLIRLISDCAGDPPEVQCPCCTQCEPV